MSQKGNIYTCPTTVPFPRPSRPEPMPKRSYDIAIPPLLDELRAAADTAKLPPFTGELSRLLEVKFSPFLTDSPFPSPRRDRDRSIRVAGSHYAEPLIPPYPGLLQDRSGYVCHHPPDPPPSTQACLFVLLSTLFPVNALPCSSRLEIEEQIRYHLSPKLFPKLSK